MMGIETWPRVEAQIRRVWHMEPTAPIPVPEAKDVWRLNELEEQLVDCDSCTGSDECTGAKHGNNERGWLTVYLPTQHTHEQDKLRWVSLQTYAVPCRYKRTEHSLDESEHRRERANVGRRFVSAQFADIELVKATKYAVGRAERYCVKREWQHGFGLAFVGDGGTGKTMLATAILSLIQRAGTETLIIPAADILPRKIDDLGDKEGKTVGDMLYERARHVAVLLIDDLGTEPPSGVAGQWAADRMNALIDARYRMKLATLITGNYPALELNARVGKRMASRLREMCEIIEMIGPDYRVTLQKRALSGREATA